MKNKDEYCFTWCISRYFNKENKDNYRITKVLK